MPAKRPRRQGVATVVRASRPELTDQDLQLLSMLAAGVSVEGVARRLELSDRTIRRRLRAICDRLGVDAPIEAVAWAARRGLI